MISALSRDSFIIPRDSLTGALLEKLQTLHSTPLDRVIVPALAVLSVPVTVCLDLVGRTIYVILTCGQTDHKVHFIAFCALLITLPLRIGCYLCAEKDLLFPIGPYIPPPPPTPLMRLVNAVAALPNGNRFLEANSLRNLDHLSPFAISVIGDFLVNNRNQELLGTLLDFPITDLPTDQFHGSRADLSKIMGYALGLRNREMIVKIINKGFRVNESGVIISALDLTPGTLYYLTDTPYLFILCIRLASCTLISQEMRDEYKHLAFWLIAEQGAIPTSQSFERSRPIGDVDFGRYLLNRCSDDEKARSTHFLFSQVPGEVEYYLRCGVHPNTILQGAPEDRLGLGITPLLYAVRQNNLAVIALLLRYGANPNVHVGLTTALREARRLGNQEAVQMLLAAGGADFQDLLRAPLILPLNFGLPGVR